MDESRAPLGPVELDVVIDALEVLQPDSDEGRETREALLAWFRGERRAWEETPSRDSTEP